MRSAWRRRMSVADRVKCPSPYAVRALLGAMRLAEHLAGGLVRGEQQDIARRYALLQQPGDAAGERARLAAPRPGDDEAAPGADVTASYCCAFSSAA